MTIKAVFAILCFSLAFISSYSAQPSFAADVETVGDLKVSGMIDNSGGEGIKFPDGSLLTTSGLNGLLFNVGLVVDDSASNTGSFASGAIKFGGSSSGEGIASQRSSGTAQNGLDFYTGSTARLTIKNNGYVGIGTRDPSDQLEITGNLRLPATTATAGIIKSGSSTLIHTYGDLNFFAGHGAGNLSMTGNSNTASGYLALYSNTSGSSNTAHGNVALASNTTGYGNTAIGSASLDYNTTGDGNTAIGSQTLWRNTTGSDNTASGSAALFSNTTGYGNTADGRSTLGANTTGFYNTALGYLAGGSRQTGSYNTFIGANSDAGADGLTNATAIGANALVSQSNSLVLGASGVKVGIGTASPTEALDVVGNVKISGTLTPGSLSSASIGSAALADLAVTTAKIASGAVTGVKLSDGAVTAAKLANGAVTSAKINVDGDVSLNHNDLKMLYGDTLHGLGWYGAGKSFVTGDNIDGPVLYGFHGGALGTTNDAKKVALAWDSTGNVSVSGEVESQSGGFKFPDGTVQTTASVPPWGQKITGAARWVLELDDNAALDRETGLVWQRTNDSTARTWDSAQNYCYNLSLGGRKGWRPPSIEELSSLVDPSQTNPALPAGHPFTNVYTTFYWSSTTYAGDSTVAWSVRFQDGYVTYNFKSSSNYIRCVRGGQ